MSPDPVSPWSHRDPVSHPSSRSKRGIEAAEARRRATDKTKTLMVAVAISLAVVASLMVAVFAVMRKLVVPTILLLVLLSVGCATPDPKAIALVDLQIASLTSMALVGGDRNTEQALRIAADGVTCRKNFHDLVDK